eukprot:1142390-Pelagomonas_calceolata.AAC.2
MLIEKVSPAVDQPESRAVGQPPCSPCCHAIQRLTTIINTRHSFSGEFWGRVYWARGSGESRHPGAWPTTLQIPISYISGFLLG